jgi:protein Mpv17
MRFFARSMSRYPIATQITTTGFLFSAGDCITQNFFEESEAFDFHRTLRLAVFGAGMAGPAMVYWYRFLNKNIVFRSPIGQLVTRVAMDQFIFAPSFLFLFFSYNGLMEGQSIDKIKEKFRKGYWPALVGNWTVWPLVQLVNFRFVPLHYQTVVVNSVALGWNSYLSMLNKRSSN